MDDAAVHQLNIRTALHYRAGDSLQRQRRPDAAFALQARKYKCYLITHVLFLFLDQSGTRQSSNCNRSGTVPDPIIVSTAAPSTAPWMMAKLRAILLPLK